MTLQPQPAPAADPAVIPAALLFRPGPALAPEAHRVARALLEDAARNRGGRVSAEAGGGWRLVAAPPALEQARRALSAVLHGRDAALVMEALAAAPPEASPPGSPEALLAALPLEGLLERQALLGFGPGGSPRAIGWRVRPRADAVASALGARWAAEPWLAHGRALVARRAAAELAPSAGALHLDMPDAAGAGAIRPVLPPASILDPPACPFAVDGPGAAALALLDPASVPEAILHLAWAPALDSLPMAYWRALRPGRVVLEGVAEEEAMDWGLSRGITRFAGARADRLLAALRRTASA